MLRVRKLVLAVAAATALTSGVAHALGLGNVSVKSSLNQPLEAEIELLEVGGLTALEIKSQLASSEEFSRAGVERQFFLTNLKFAPVIRADGKSVLRITSERSVREPYLNFLVELLWPNGRVLREYTVLLDPPMYTPQEIVYLPATTEPLAKPRTTPQPVAKKTAPARQAAPASTRRITVSGDNQYRVEKNDTLWSIASRVGGNATTQQTMLAIRDLNPQAFINGDINRLKAGQVLTLPDDAQIQQRSKSAAIAEVKAQTAAQTASAPETAASVKQLDARQRTTADAAPAKVEQQDSLRLVASDTGQAATGSERGQDNSAALLEQLSEAKETLDSSQRENTDLHDRVTELNNQIDKLQQLVELKNTQLASLQHLETMAEQQPEVIEEPEVDAAVEVVDEDVDVTAEEAVESEQQTEQATEETAETELAVDTTAEAVTEPELIAEQEAEKPVTEAPKPKPVVSPLQEIPSPEQSLMEELMDNPLFMPAVGGGSLLLLLLLLMSASRRKKQAKELSLAASQDAADTSDATDDAIPEFTADADEELPIAEALPDFDTVEAVQEAPEVSAESVNEIAEADNYIAYGRFNQAADVLMQAIDKKPQRADLRFKLLEVLADLEDKKGFTRQFNEMVEMGVAPSELEAVKARYPHLIESGAPTMDHADDAEISLDDLSLETPEFDIDAFAEPKLEPSTDELSDDFFDALSDSPVSEESEQAEKALLDLDELSLTLNETLDVIEPETELNLESTDFELSDFDELDAELLASDPLATEAPSTTENLEGDLVDADELTDADFDFDTLTEIEDAEFAEVVKEELTEASLDFELPDDFDLSVTEEQVVELTDGLSLEDTDLSSDFTEISAEMDELAETLKDSMAVDELLDAELDSLDIDFTAEPSETAAEEKIEQEVSLDIPDDLGDIELPTESLEEFDFGDLEESLSFERPADFETELDLEDAPELDSNLMDELEKLSEADIDEQPEAGTTFAAVEEALEDDFSFLAGTDETTTKLDLARAYVDMGDSEGAKDILEEVLSEGNDEQQQEARELMKKLS